MVNINRGREAQKEDFKIILPWELADAQAKQIPLENLLALLETCADRSSMTSFSKYVVYAYLKTYPRDKKKDMKVIVYRAYKWYFSNDFLFSEYAFILENIHRHGFITWKMMYAMKNNNEIHRANIPDLESLRKVVKKLEDKRCSKK